MNALTSEEWQHHLDQGGYAESNEKYLNQGYVGMEELVGFGLVKWREELRMIPSFGPKQQCDWWSHFTEMDKS